MPFNPIEDDARRLHALRPWRTPALVTRFLLQGMRITTLSYVPAELRPAQVRCKVAFATLVALLDDFADHPELRDLEVLEALMCLATGQRVGRLPTPHARETAAFLVELRDQLLRHMRSLPRHAELQGVLRLDLHQLLQSQRFSALLPELPGLLESEESVWYRPPGMMIVLAGTLDLMCCTTWPSEALGGIRQLLLLGERTGKLFNDVATADRERSSAEQSGGLGGAGPEARSKALERCEWLLARMKETVPRARGIDGVAYIEGIRPLGALYRRMEGTV